MAKHIIKLCGFDAMNRLIVKDLPTDPNIYFTYDIMGRLVDVNDGRQVIYGGGRTRYKYDRIGRIKEVNDIDRRIVKYEYNNRSLRSKLTYPDNSFITYTYDALYRLRQIKDGSGNNLARYDYDGLSRRTLLTLGNDANTIYEYDLDNRLSKLKNNFNGNGSLTYEYASYDKVGNRKSMKVNDSNTQVYNYDKLYQLTRADYNDGNNMSFYYDKLGNRTKTNNGAETVYKSNSLNQYTNVGTKNYSYDDNGNLTYTGEAGGHYGYDCENRMIVSWIPISFNYYDFDGRRIRKTYSQIKYCYDGRQILGHYNDSNTLVRKFIYGPGIDKPICMIDISDANKIYYYHFDGLCSIVALSNSNKQIIEKYSYDAFGTPTVHDANNSVVSVSSVANPYMFTGREYDSESGLYYYRARYYKPSIGRFMETDPIGYEDDYNLYRYVNNNPVNKIDPLGLSHCSDWKDSLKGGKDDPGATEIYRIAMCMSCCSEQFVSNIFRHFYCPLSWPAYLARQDACRTACGSTKGRIGPWLPI